MNPMKVSSRIILAQCLSDHNPILIKCEDTKEKFFPSRYRMNLLLSKDEEMREKMAQLLQKELDFLSSREN